MWIREGARGGLHFLQCTSHRSSAALTCTNIYSLCSKRYGDSSPELDGRDKSDARHEDGNGDAACDVLLDGGAGDQSK